MPTTVSGLIVFTAFLVPGFVHYVQRRRRAPQRRLSPLVETATLTTVSTFTNLVAVGIFALVRGVKPNNTPDVGRLAREGMDYAGDRIGYLLGWGAGVLLLSTALALLLALGSEWFPGSRLFPPLIVDVSAWYQIFDDECPDGLTPYVGCAMANGSYYSGLLAWYSTEVDEVRDRDLALAPPFIIQEKDPGNTPADGFERLILSAHEIRQVYVSYVDANVVAGPQEADDGKADE